MAFNFEGSSGDSGSWELESMSDKSDSRTPGEGVERYVSPEIEAWRRANGMDTSPDGKRLDILGGEGGDWLVDANDKSQVNAAADMLKGRESEGWTLQ